MSDHTGLPPYADIVIVGGGMAGLSLAAILSGFNRGVAIAVLDATSLDELASDAAPIEQLPPSFDARSTALSESSRQIYHQAGVWQLLSASACAIETIHVSDRGNPGSTRMNARDHGLSGLGYVIENRILGKALVRAVGQRQNVTLHSPLTVEKLVPAAGGMDVHAGGQVCRTGLVVAADGANSRLLQSLGIHTDIKDYGQCALIANVALEQPHRGVAYERFTDEGPIALLPLVDAGEEFRAALVWTLTPHRAARLLQTGEADFLEALHRRFGFRAGCFRRCGTRFGFPLKLMVAQEQVRSHLVIAGNAAHFLHPVAGQGFNLALRDVAKLSEHLLEALAAGRNPGQLSVLEAYIDSQRIDQRNTIRFSHALPALFANRSVASAVLRNAGLIALDLIDPLREEFAGFGAGLANPGMKLRGGRATGP